MKRFATTSFANDLWLVEYLEGSLHAGQREFPNWANAAIAIQEWIIGGVKT